MSKVLNPSVRARLVALLPLAFAIALFTLSSVTFVLAPFTGDVKVFMASANIASYKGVGLLYDAYNTWELKGVFNRVLMYAIYKLACHIVSFGTMLFERVASLVYALLVVGVCCGAAVLLGRPAWAPRKVAMCGLLLCTCFFATQTWGQMQAEMTCSLVLLFAFALYVHARNTGRHAVAKTYGAGLLLGTLFFFKSASAIMAVAFVCAAFAWEEHHGARLSRASFGLLVLGGVSMLAVGFASILIINPAELQDMLDASAFQSTLLSGGSRSFRSILSAFCDAYFYACLRFPALFVGTVAFAGNLVEALRDKNWVAAFMHAGLWIVPSLFVVLSNQYFGYHYLLFLFPSLFEMLLFAERCEETPAARVALLVGAGLLVSVVLTLFFGGVLVDWAESSTFTLLVKLLLAGALVVALLPHQKIKLAFCCGTLLFSTFVYVAFISAFSANFSVQVALDKRSYELDAAFAQASFDEPVLYLDGGGGAYTLGADSYLKYFFPLPIQRISDDSEYSDLDCRVESLEQIAAYSGEYIVMMESWIFMNEEYPSIIELLEGYELVGELVYYSPGYDLFALDTEGSLYGLDLYQKLD